MQIFAHRGASARWPENTMAAFRAALEAGVDGIETDLRLTRDGRIVLFHDPTLARMTGDPRRVDELTFGELRRLRVAGAHPIPSLEELREEVAGRVVLNLEVKSPGVFPVLARALGTQADEVLVTAARWRLLPAFRAARPGVRTGPVLTRMGSRQAHALSHLRFDAVSLQVDGYGRTARRWRRENRCPVLLWVVNDPARAEVLSSLGVDGIFTDDPAAFRRAPEGAMGSDERSSSSRPGAGEQPPFPHR
ncbi:MAG: glycerophosphodiester phosphodiesterase family protein [Deferrisomatales bacterium]